MAMPELGGTTVLYTGVEKRGGGLVGQSIMRKVLYHIVSEEVLGCHITTDRRGTIHELHTQGHYYYWAIPRNWSCVL